MGGLCLGLIAALILSARSPDAQIINPVSLPSSYSAFLQAAYRARGLVSHLEGLEQFVSAFSFHPQADGGGDGGSGGGDGSGDGGSGTGTGGDSTGDNSGSASDSTGPGDNGDPDPD